MATEDAAPLTSTRLIVAWIPRFRAGFHVLVSPQLAWLDHLLQEVDHHIKDSVARQAEARDATTLAYLLRAAREHHSATVNSGLLGTFTRVSRTTVGALCSAFTVLAFVLTPHLVMASPPPDPGQAKSTARAMVWSSRVATSSLHRPSIPFWLAAGIGAGMAAPAYGQAEGETVGGGTPAQGEVVHSSTPRVRRRLLPTVPGFDVAVPVAAGVSGAGAPTESSISITNASAVPLEARVVVDRHVFSYTVAAQSVVTIPGAELGVAGENSAYVDLGGAADVSVSSRVERSSIVDGVRRWTGSSTAGVPLTQFLRAGEVSKSPLSAADYTVTIVPSRDDCAFGFKVLDENGGVKVVKDNYAVSALKPMTFNLAEEAGVTLADKDQLQLFPLCTMTAFVTKTTPDDRTTRTPLSGEDFENSSHIPKMMRDANGTNLRTTLGAMNVGATQGIVTFNFAEYGAEATVGGGMDPVASTHQRADDALTTLVHLPLGTAHAGTSTVWVDSGSVVVYAEMANSTTTTVLPLIDEKYAFGGAAKTRGLFANLSDNADEKSAIGLTERSGAPQTVSFDCYHNGEKAKTFTQDIGGYRTARIENVVSERCGLNNAEGVYLVATGPNIESTLHGWSETTSTKSLDTHVQAATRMSAAPPNQAPTFECYDEMSNGTCDFYDANNDLILDVGLAVSTHSPYPRQGTMKFNDADGDTLTYTWRNTTFPGAPLPGGWSSNGPEFSYLPTVPGNVMMECKAEDGRGKDVTVTVTFVTPT